MRRIPLIWVGVVLFLCTMCSCVGFLAFRDTNWIQAPQQNGFTANSTCKVESYLYTESGNNINGVYVDIDNYTVNGEFADTSRSVYVAGPFLKGTSTVVEVTASMSQSLKPWTWRFNRSGKVNITVENVSLDPEVWCDTISE